MTFHGVDEAEGDDDALAVIVRTDVTVATTASDADTVKVVSAVGVTSGFVGDMELDRVSVRRAVGDKDAVDDIERVRADEVETVEDEDIELVLAGEGDAMDVFDAQPDGPGDLDGDIVVGTVNDPTADGDAELDTDEVRVGTLVVIEKGDSDDAGERDAPGAELPDATPPDDDATCETVDAALKLTDSAGGAVGSVVTDELDEKDGDADAEGLTELTVLCDGEPDGERLTLTVTDGLDDTDVLGVALASREVTPDADGDAVSLAHAELDVECDGEGVGDDESDCRSDALEQSLNRAVLVMVPVGEIRGVAHAVGLALVRADCDEHAFEPVIVTVADAASEADWIDDAEGDPDKLAHSDDDGLPDKDGDPEVESDASGELEADPDDDVEPDADALIESYDAVELNDACADTDMWDAVDDSEGVALTVAVPRGVPDGVGCADEVGMTRPTRPTPRNSRPSFGAVATTAAGAAENMAPTSPPAETRPSAST